MTTLYLIQVNGICFADSVEEYTKNYVLRVLRKYPELKVKVFIVQVGEVKPA